MSCQINKTYLPRGIQILPLYLSEKTFIVIILDLKINFELYLGSMFGCLVWIYYVYLILLRSFRILSTFLGAVPFFLYFHPPPQVISISSKIIFMSELLRKKKKN